MRIEIRIAGSIWRPLYLAYPKADIPVVQLSIQPHLGPRHHLQLGRALAPLRQRGVLVIGSGNTTHNLRALNGYGLDADPPAWVSQFVAWLTAALAEGRVDDLIRYRQLAPFAVQNHPTEEHLLPLFVALGAGGSGQLIHNSYTYGILSMASYRFD